MKVTSEAQPLTTGEQYQLDKQQGKNRYYSRKLDKRRADGQQRLRPVGKRQDLPTYDDLDGIDLSRVKSLADLNLE